MTRNYLMLSFSLLILPLLSAQNWVKVIEGPQSKSANQVLRLSNGDFIIAGQVNDPGEWYRHSGLLLRTTPNGEVIWEYRYGTMTSDGEYIRNEHFEDMTLTTDGYLIGVGTQTPTQANAYALADVMVVKIDLNGNEIWRRSLNWGKTDNGWSVTALPAGEFAVCGNTNSYSTSGDLDGFIFKMNPNGEVQWIKTYDVEKKEDWLYKILLTNDQQLLAVGSAPLSGVGNRTWALKTDLNGELIWQKTYAGYAIKGSSVVESSDGHFGICGQGYGNSTSTDNLIMEIDGNGSVTWGSNYPAPSFTDELFDILPCSEGGYAAVGMSGTDPFDGYYLIRVDAQGDTVQATTLFDGAPSSEFANSLTWASNGALLAVGGRLKPEGDYDLLITEFSGFGCSTPNTSAAQETPSNNANISPNPANEYIRIEAGSSGPFQCRISNALGMVVYSNWSQELTLRVPCLDFPSGPYFYSLIWPDGSITSGKLMVQH